MDFDFLINNFHRFVQRFSNKIVNIDYLAAGCQPGSWVMAKFSRFKLEAPNKKWKLMATLSSFQEDQVYVYNCVK